MKTIPFLLESLDVFITATAAKCGVHRRGEKKVLQQHIVAGFGSDQIAKNFGDPIVIWRSDRKWRSDRYLAIESPFGH